MMLKKAWLCTFCLFLLTVGCTSTNSTNSRQDSPNNSNEITTSNTDGHNKLRGRIEQISKTAQGRMGVTATVLETGESVSLNGNQRFPMQSVYKFPIAMAVLDRVDRGKLKLDQKIRIEASDVVRGSQILDQKASGVELTLTELLKYMVSSSDNTACDVLLRLVVEPKIVTQYLRGLGVKDIVVANTEQELRKNPDVQYRNDATPDAAVGLLRTFHEGKGLSTFSQALLRRLMTETTTGKQRIRGLLPKGTVVAHKTGTSATVKGVTAATNDVGIVTLPNGQNLAMPSLSQIPRRMRRSVSDRLPRRRALYGMNGANRCRLFTLFSQEVGCSFAVEFAWDGIRCWQCCRQRHPGERLFSGELDKLIQLAVGKICDKPNKAKSCCIINFHLP